ncbi:MAG: hypothetical protein ABFS39_10930 [Pseudomonadota bacterium]
MHRLSKKLLAVLLTLLLGFSPLQGVMAGVAASFDQEEGVHQMTGMHGDMAMATDQAEHNCEQRHADDGCNSHSCSSAQCASCVLALLPFFSFPTNLTATSLSYSVADGLESQLSSPFLRPPRA